ncbi:MAG: GNAT family N-acetyltransferase [Ruminiclostridium sp.]|nr:GNAT family N-acetyltransferase [Ruminiclostridium sp.]
MIAPFRGELPFGAYDIFTEKIRAYAEGYGFDYGFCRFYEQDGGKAVICSYYGDAAAALTGELSPSQAEELSAFLTCGQFNRLLMPWEMCSALGLEDRAERRSIMRGGIAEQAPLRSEVPLDSVYDIVRTGFDIDYETWYTDMSHMTRHGIAKAYLLDGACAVRMYASRGIAYVSYVCTLPGLRGSGLGTKLLRGVCAEERKNGFTVHIVCEDSLRGFYERAGFSLCGYAACDIG